MFFLKDADWVGNFGGGGSSGTSDDVTSVAGRTGAVVLTKADVGLGNVDNTADSTKNVLSATKWNTARTISFIGGATGSGLVDGTQNVTIQLTVDLATCVKNDDARITTWEAAATNSHTHANKAILDATTASYTTELDVKLSGIAEGANNYTHPNSAIAVGTYRSVTVNDEGHVTSGTNPTTVSGYGLTDVYTKDEVDAFSHTHANKAILDATTASYTTELDVKLSGVAEGANNYTHPNSVVTAGTYRSVTVDNQGHIVSGTNPTTVSDYGLSDVYTKEEVDDLISALEQRIIALENPTP